MIFSICNVGADLGDFNDYSSDYGSDWGGGYDSGGYDSDWGGGYGYGYGGYGYYDDRDRGGDDGSIIDFSAVIIAAVIIAIALYSNKKVKKSRNTVAQGVNIAVPDNTEEIVKAITENDKNYSNDKFIGWVKEVFITLQTAWSKRDFEMCRPFEKEELFRQHVTQIQGYKDRGWINKLDRINVNQAYLYKYIRDAEYEYLTVYIQSRMSDYIIDENTGNVIKGDPNAEYHLRYLYTFIRKTGVLTDPAKSNNSVVACPHCGAPTQITSAGKCEYCGFIVTTGEYDWVLSNIEAIKNGSNIDKGGVIIRQ